MFIDNSTRLLHMRDAAQKIRKFSEGKTRSDLESDEMLALSLVKCIEIIGEAASKISPERQAQLPQIPWRKIIGMRNRLIHAYFEIDFDVVWDTITQVIPGFITELEEVIVKEQE